MKNEIEDALQGQIPEFEEPAKAKKISNKILNKNKVNDEAIDAMAKANNISISKIGDNIFTNTDVREGWIEIDRELLEERSKFYPANWRFYVRPATVEAIRNWSMIDDKNGNSIDDVFNEILKYCLSIKSDTGIVSWQSINNWDRFFFVLLIRQYTFQKGENNIEFWEDCEYCEKPVKFELDPQALMYELPDDEVMKFFNPDLRLWEIDPADSGIPSENIISLYLPTVEKDANIKSWLIQEYQENQKKKVNPVFIKFLPWLCPKISKDFGTARAQIRKAENLFNSWDIEMFSFMDDVLRNITVTPQLSIKSICQYCSEEAVAQLRFPDGVRSLFNVVHKSSKFGTK